MVVALLQAQTEQREGLTIRAKPLRLTLTQAMEAGEPMCQGAAVAGMQGAAALILTRMVQAAADLAMLIPVLLALAVQQLAREKPLLTAVTPIVMAQVLELPQPRFEVEMVELFLLFKGQLYD
ncbi:MAG: hypothetical protein [Siphoviridae sp. ctdEk19]|nr:MAG: hypothetical protein [Siphoviridae sp. ctdEk19]